MSLIVSRKSFTPAPEGVFPAVLVDAVDLGEVTGKFGTKHKVRLVWQITEKMKDGRPFIVSKTYTSSLHPKSGLAKDLTAWRGRAFTAEEAKSFDLDILIAKCCTLVINHSEVEGETYANIVAITKLNRDKWFAGSSDYKRKERPVEAPKEAAGPWDDFGDGAYSDTEPLPDGEPETQYDSSIPF
jgi:hypothetical protein